MRNRSANRFGRLLAGIVFGALLCSAGSLHAVTVDFDQAEYVVAPGDTVAITLSFGEPVPDGLTGYHLRLNAEASGLFVPDGSSIAIVDELDMDLFGEEAASRTVESNFAEILGFSESGNAYGGVTFVTFTLPIDPEAPVGAYGLTLQLPLEGSFVDGNIQTIDDELTLGTATLVVEIPPPSVSQVPQIDKETGDFSMFFTAFPGRDYVLQVSDDLENWDDLTILATPSSGLVTFTDSSFADHPRRFYRLVE